MVARRLDRTARAVGGELVAPGGAGAEVRWSGASLDTRTLEGGELFFAFPGERVDGHDFVADDLDRGAAAAVVSRRLDVAGPQIVVPDTFEALHALTRAVRSEEPELLVGITGSSGKTTTKELAAALFGTVRKTARTLGNFNNLYGFPISLLSMPEGTEVMVAEMGMSTPGELGRVSRLGRPDAVMLLNVRAVHLENFASVAEIAEAKAEIFDGLAEDGLLVANRDDPEVTRVARRHAEAHPGVRLLFFGQGSSEEIEARLVDLAPREGAPGSRFVLELGGERHRAELPLHGRYNAMNALAAAAAAHALGVPPEAIVRGLASVRPASHRGAVHRLADGVDLIDDSYNSNPHALMEALASAAELPAERRVAILGDMLELGPEAPRFHRECGVRAAELGFAPVVGVGELARHLSTAASEAGAEAFHLDDAAAATAWVLDAVRPGDLVLVKGSRGVGLDAVVEALLERFAPADDTETDGEAG